MNWVKKSKLLAIKAIKYNSRLCIEIKDLWQALHESFNLAQHWHINNPLLSKIPNKPQSEWSLFLSEKFLSTIHKYSNNSTLGHDKLSWRYLKEIVKNMNCLSKFINIANMCIELEYWLSYFKMFMSIIIPEPNKVWYNTLKMFRLIILLNTLGKLIEKVIGKRLQFQALSKNVIHSC